MRASVSTVRFSMTLMGVSTDNLALLESKIGCESPVVRAYRAIDRITSYTPLGGRLVIGSAKPKIGTNLVPIADLVAGKYAAYFTQNAVDLAALPAAPYGKKHICINWHEFDVGTLNGTVAQINSVILAANHESRQAAAGKLDIGVCIGSYNMSLYEGFAPALLDGDIVLIDQPYNTNTSANAPSAQSVIAPRIAALKALGVKRIGIAEYGSVPFIGRPAWLMAANLYYQNNDIEVATYFDNGSNAIVGKSDEYALDSAIYESRMVAAEQLLRDSASQISAIANGMLL